MDQIDTRGKMYTKGLFCFVPSHFDQNKRLKKSAEVSHFLANFENLRNRYCARSLFSRKHFGKWRPTSLSILIDATEEIFFFRLENYH
jgi:hypothetical protein